MKTYDWKEPFEERLVTCSPALGMGNRFIVIEHVPARVCRETGEQLFSPDTVSRLQPIVRGQRAPGRILQTPAHEFADPAG